MSLTFLGGVGIVPAIMSFLSLRPVPETVSFRNVTVQTDRIEEMKNKVVSWEFTDTRMLTDTHVYIIALTTLFLLA